MAILLAVGAGGFALWREGSAAAPGSSHGGGVTLAGTVTSDAPVSVPSSTAVSSRTIASSTSAVPSSVTTTTGTEPDSAAGGPVKVTIATAGDIMVHESQLAGSFVAASNSYDFHPSFAPIAPYIQSADFAVANFETRTAGAALGYSGFPFFNTPGTIVQAVKDAGFDLLGVANNHALDQGLDGLLKTLDTFDVYDMPSVGNHRSAADQEQVLIADVGGVKVAFLSFTEMLSRATLPSEAPWCVDMLGDGSACIACAKAARAQGAEIVIALLHWGEEDQRTQSANQWTIGTRLLKNGVDVVIGSHPHVVQPITRLTVDRSGHSLPGYIAYSLGNFLSNQTWQYSDSGLVLYVDVVKDANGARVSGLRYLPVYVQKQPVAGQDQWRVLPVLPGVEPSTDIALSQACRARMAEVWTEIQAAVERPASGVSACTPSEFDLDAAADPLGSAGGAG
jgi:poly-gamma-glutamate capsule biosynthesis protein CapA/YwtB (metallophosphatase superfamily)